MGETANFVTDRKKKDRADHKDVEKLIDREINESVRRFFPGRGIFDEVLRQMNKHEPGHKGPDHGFVQVRIKEKE